ncbi:hypothetical protein V6N12_028427 [Hibiscus sabdariffa]|uniref:Uncharacterized protein n=1 Tax=Hibiscus sabdariffa TaxID=183260 RepID=A0ABR2F5T2_9ROSI
MHARDPAILTSHGPMNSLSNHFLPRGTLKILLFARKMTSVMDVKGAVLDSFVCFQGVVEDHNLKVQLIHKLLD